MFVTKMIPVLRLGSRTISNYSRNMKLRININKVCCNLMSRLSQMPESKPFLPHKWTDLQPSISVCCECSKAEQQSVKIRSNTCTCTSFNESQKLETVMQSEIIFGNKVKESNNLLRTINCSVIFTRGLCTISLSKIDLLHVNKSYLEALQPHQYFTTKSTMISDDVDSWEMLVDYEKLSTMELRIHERHRDAVKQGKTMYVDPLTGYQVMTRLAHLQRGECCGNACRHCPYGQSKVMEEKNKKTFNSAFYV